MRKSTTTEEHTMFACCETGYCQAEERDARAAREFGEGWEILATDPESRRMVSADDMPLGEEERDMLDVGEALAHYVSGERW